MYGVPASGVSMGPGMMYLVRYPLVVLKSPEVTQSHPSVPGIIRNLHDQAESHRELQQQGNDIIHVGPGFEVRGSMYDIRCSTFLFLDIFDIGDVPLSDERWQRGGYVMLWPLDGYRTTVYRCTVPRVRTYLSVRVGGRVSKSSKEVFVLVPILVLVLVPDHLSFSHLLTNSSRAVQRGMKRVKLV